MRYDTYFCAAAVLANTSAKVRRNSIIERINREIRHEASVEGTFPDDHSASNDGLYLAAAFRCHPAGQQEIHEYENIHFLEKDKNILDKTHSSAHAGVAIPEIDAMGYNALPMAL